VFTIDLDVGDIVLENGGDVDLCAIVSVCALQCEVVHVGDCCDAVADQLG
jgi:hypothetical protein